MTTTEIIATPQGDGRLHLDLAETGAPVLVLGHGAGGGVDAVDLAALARALPARGISVVRFEQPWRLAGRKVASPPARLDEAWRPAVAAARARTGAGRLVAGGRSAGARVACRTATELAVDGVVCCAFPLHPPGRPEKSRLAELEAPAVPVLVLQGTRDAFGSADDLRAAVGGTRPELRVVEVAGADHGMRVTKHGPVDAAGVRELIIDTVAAFCLQGIGPASAQRRDG